MLWLIGWLVGWMVFTYCSVATSLPTGANIETRTEREVPHIRVRNTKSPRRAAGVVVDAGTNDRSARRGRS